MKYIKVTNKLYRSPDSRELETRYIGGSVETMWVNARPTLLSPNLKEWFIHKILQKHFTFGQPYCVVCGKEEMTNQL